MDVLHAAWRGVLGQCERFMHVGDMKDHEGVMAVLERGCLKDQEDIYRSELKSSHYSTLELAI